MPAAKLSQNKEKTAPPYHHGRLREALIEAGLELIAEKGPLALTLREIGSRLGVSRTAAYRHFADKTELLNAIREAGFIEFGNALRQAREQAGPKFAARLAAMGRAYLQFAREHSAHFQVMFSADAKTDDPDADTPANRAFRVLLDTVLEGQQHGEVRAGDPMPIVSVIWGMIHGVSVLRLDEVCRMEDAYASILLTGISAK